MAGLQEAETDAGGFPDWLRLGTAFALVFGFTYTDDLIEFARDLLGGRWPSAVPWFVFALDFLLVVWTALLKWRTSDVSGRATFVRRMVRSRWGAAAALVVAGHVSLIATYGARERLNTEGRLWVSGVATLLFITAMALLLVTVLTEDSDKATRGWIIPVVLGAFVAQLASALWYPVIDVEIGCAGDVSAAYFANIGHIIPVVLLAVGMEMNYLRRSGIRFELGQRVAALLTVAMLAVSELLAFSMIVKAESPRCGVAAVWHEYISFVFTAQTLTTGLATVVWLLILGQAAASKHSYIDDLGKG